jgi:hypothetical protein
VAAANRSGESMKYAVLLLLLLLGGIAPASSQVMFGAEQQAQQHCPKDTVVWLNIPTSIYHMPGMRWYGATKHGAYVCQGEADKAGYGETRNGQ